MSKLLEMVSELLEVPIRPSDSAYPLLGEGRDRYRLALGYDRAFSRARAQPLSQHLPTDLPSRLPKQATGRATALR
jgi:hypothetical protein